MIITGESRKPSFLKKYTEITGASVDTDVSAQSGATGQSPPSNHVQDATYSTSYESTVPQSGQTVKQKVSATDSKGFDLLSEGLEEAITEVTEPWAQALIYKGKDADFATLESVGNAFLGGVFMSAVGNVAALPAEIANKDMVNAAAESAYVQAMQGADAQLQKSLQEVRAKILTGETLTAEDLGKVLEAASKAGIVISPEQVAQAISKTETREADWDTAMQQAFRGETAT